VQALRVEIAEGFTSAGLDMMNGEIADMQKLGVTVRVFFKYFTSFGINSFL